MYPYNKKAKNPNKDITIIYEAGGRDIENPFSGESLDMLIEETEGTGSWEIDVRNLSRRDKGGYPTEDEDSIWSYQKDVQRYPFSFSKKGSPSGKGYPLEKYWWQKALSFKQTVASKYTIICKD